LQKPCSLQTIADRLAQAVGGRRHHASGELDAADRILGDARLMRVIREQLRNIARFPDLPVMIVGETGTGKELVAQALHQLTSPQQPFVSINCAAVPANLFESELFGHENGAFTGARGQRIGLLEGAERGTVFLDEVGEMPLELQAKLLRVLETRELRRLGSNQTHRLNARVISASNRRLLGEGSPLRSDLYFRLAGFTVIMPPLRERREDIEQLARYFISELNRRYATAPRDIAASALDVLLAHSWPGNIRELRAVIQVAAVSTGGAIIGNHEVSRALQDHDWTPSAPQVIDNPVSGLVLKGNPEDSPMSLGDLERSLIIEAYESSGQNLSQAARSLGIPRTTLRDRLRRYGVR